MTEAEHRKRLLDLLDQIPTGVPAGWEKETLAVGGLMYLGFSNLQTEKLVVISSQRQSVIDCGTGQEEIERAFCLALSDAFRETCRSVSNPYEGKGTAEEIVRRCKEYLSGFENTEKVFYDLKEEIE